MQRTANRITVPGPKHFGARAQRWIRGAALIVIGATFIAAAEPPQQTPPPDSGYLRPESNRPPDKNDLMVMNSEKAKKENFEAANAERKRQIADDTARLLALATELKREVDKTSKDTLSISVIRKADTIEKLAKGVKEKMKLTVGGS